ncbi:MAG: hypothetical protein IJ752_06135 [Alphaproteobacteria bacterium]|nr:hypothetical protein [Alphaproteobacteria bacterium]
MATEQEITDAKNNLIALTNDYRRVFETEEGRRVLADLKTYCRVNPSEALTADNSTDPLKLAVLVGRRDVIDRIERFKDTPLQSIFKLYNL